MAKAKIFKISDDQIKQMYLDGNSLNDIAKIAQDTKGLMALRRKLQELGVDTTKNMKRYSSKISKAGKKYRLNEHLFDIIDTEEKAYWLGWYMTDGYNNQSKNQIALRLQERDEEILLKLQQFLETDTPIYHYNRHTNNAVELLIISKTLSDALAKLGVIQNKTHHKSIPNLPKPLIKPFLRGYFDGDGCISITKRKNRGPESITIQVTFTGNEEPIKYIEEFLRKELNLTERKLQYIRNSCTVHYSGTRVCLNILDWLYKDTTLYLKRKYDKYLQIVSRQSNLQ